MRLKGMLIFPDVVRRSRKKNRPSSRSYLTRKILHEFNNVIDFTFACHVINPSFQLSSVQAFCAGYKFLPVATLTAIPRLRPSGASVPHRLYRHCSQYFEQEPQLFPCTQDLGLPLPRRIDSACACCYAIALGARREALPMNPGEHQHWYKSESF